MGKRLFFNPLPLLSENKEVPTSVKEDLCLEMAFIVRGRRGGRGGAAANAEILEEMRRMQA